MESKTMPENSIQKNTKIMGNGFEIEVKNGAKIGPGVIFRASKIKSNFGGVEVVAESD